ncbi:MAG TPA: hypothetical protein VIU40_09440 [Geobacteraceae bacterium]
MTVCPPKYGFWVEGWGFTTQLAAFELSLITPTAKAVKVGVRSWSIGQAWSHDDGLMVMWWGNVLQAINFPSTAPVNSETYTGINGTVVLSDRSLSFDGQTVRGWPITNYVGSGIGTIELNLGAGWSQAQGGLIFPRNAEANQWWLCNLYDGRIVLYDATAKALMTGFGGRVSTTLPLRAVGYSPSLDVFITLSWDAGRTTAVMNYYANEPVAATVSAPVFSAPPRAGSFRKVKSQVLGDANEPCTGRVVTFSATVGTIPTPSVETDTTGWAETDYISPMTPATGETVTATLVE